MPRSPRRRPQNEPSSGSFGQGRPVCKGARADAPPPFKAGWNDRIAAITAGGMHAILEGTLARWFTVGCPAAVRDKAAAMILSTSVPGYIGCAEALKTLDSLKDLDKLRAPVLYVCGSEDMGAPKEAMSTMADATRLASLTALPGLAHIPNMEDPVAFVAAVSGWLEASA